MYKKKIYVLLVVVCSGISITSNRCVASEDDKNWFQEMFIASTTTDSTHWKDVKLNQMWDELRSRYPNPTALLQMSWEERDQIWKEVLPEGADQFARLAGKYRRAYIVSCHERGVKPQIIDTTLHSLADVIKVRNRYLNSREAEYVILTPKPPKRPQINSVEIYGVRPGNEVIYRIAATGERPMRYEVSDLPKGCTFDATFGVIRGKITKEGVYPFTISAQNEFGKSKKTIRLVVGPSIALTPPMGWNSWNSFACNVTAEDIKNTAKQFIKTSLADYGWTYINIDDCWMKVPDIDGMPDEDKAIREPYYKQGVDFRTRTKKVRFNEQELVGETRNAQGAILANKDFPDMRALTDYLHQYGFKAGLYTSPGPLTCQRYEGSYGHEHTDAQQFAAWGFDYLKYDWCGYRTVAPKPSLEEVQSPYRLMGQALKSVKRDIVYSICQYGMKDVWKWGASIGGNAWRTTGDIRDNWKSVSNIGFNKQVGLAPYAGPGHWNDPDMLVVGYVGWSQHLRPTYLSPNEQYTHISLWSLLSAPLLIGCDLTRLDDFTYGLLSNAEVIAINQDILGKQASRVIKDNQVQVWSKPLSDGSLAVGIFNLGETPVHYQLSLADLQLAGKHQIRDLWKQENIGESDARFSVSINRHGVKLLKIK